jgi:hypothetical protein
VKALKNFISQIFGTGPTKLGCDFVVESNKMNLHKQDPAYLLRDRPRRERHSGALL